jgi:rhamnose utilization protein RhaD (predicted bifunctional aldolase and dehydrogenase)/NAD(P)-dependent dehydrogenase (short-subunit alcohol dehydrogenase family)
MLSLWSEKDALSYIEHYGKLGVNPDVALRVYASRILGMDRKLVLHGGGNSSVKTQYLDLFGKPTDVLCIKGSGWDMASIEPAGFPAVRLSPLLSLRELKTLDDAEMVNFLRCNLLDSAAPNPSIETLLHAFFPHKFVDHTHSTAILSLTDQPEGERICRDVFGERMGYVPYIMPGFLLSKKGIEEFEKNPSIEGLVLLNHGILTFGDTARQSYERMVTAVSLAEERLTVKRKSFPTSTPRSAGAITPSTIAPVIRGLLAFPKENGTWQRWILDFRSNNEILTYVNGEELHRYSQQGVITPDHNIRTKNWPLVLPFPEEGKLDAWAKESRILVEKYVLRYHEYFNRNNIRAFSSKVELDPIPRVVLVPGVGLFGVGASKKDAAIVADIAENTVSTILDAEAIGNFCSLPEPDLFDMEYWSLEQAKLGRVSEKIFSRQIVAITGGGSGIGAATALAFAKKGAEVAVLDINGDAAQSVAKQCGPSAIWIACDVTKLDSVRNAFEQICLQFGGVDIILSNAGAVWEGSVGKISDQDLRQSFELNFFSHQCVAQTAVKVLTLQKIGGSLLFNTSKQALNPGKLFGPYGLPKAATLFLMKQYALDYGCEGIRSNAVNADRVRTGLLTKELISSRATARGIPEKEYMSGNLLKIEVKAEDVADAFTWLASANKTTACTITVDGGNIEASLR